VTQWAPLRPLRHGFVRLSRLGRHRHRLVLSFLAGHGKDHASRINHGPGESAPGPFHIYSRRKIKNHLSSLSAFAGQVVFYFLFLNFLEDLTLASDWVELEKLELSLNFLLVLARENHVL